MRNSTNSTAKIRSSHRRCSVKKSVLKIVAKFTRKNLCQSLFFNKVPGLRPSKKWLRAPFLQNTSGQLLLKNNYQAFKNLFQNRRIVYCLALLCFCRKIVQKQSFRGVQFKRCSEKFRKIHRDHLCQSLFLIKLQALGLRIFQIF